MKSKKSSKDIQLLINIGLIFIQLITMALQVRQVFAASGNGMNEVRSLIITIIYIVIWIIVIWFLRKHCYNISLKMSSIIFGITLLVVIVSIIGNFFDQNIIFTMIIPVTFLFGIQFSGIYFLTTGLFGSIIVLVVSLCLFIFSIEKLIR